MGGELAWAALANCCSKWRASEEELNLALKL